MLDPRIAQGARSFAPDSPQDSMMRALQLIGAQRQNALQQMQMQAYGDEKKAKADTALRTRNALMAMPSPEFVASQNALAVGGGRPTPENAARIRPVDPRSAALFQLAQAGAIDPEKYISTLDPNFGRQEVARTLERAGAGGRPENVQLSKYGDVVGSAMPKAVEMKMLNLGGFEQAYDPYAMLPGQKLQRTQTPDSIASNRVSMRGQDMTDGRARDQMAQSQQQFNARRADEAARPPGGNARTGPMSVTLQKELLESDDAVQSAAAVVRSLTAAKAQNNKAYEGYLAKPRAQLMSNLGGSKAADATIDIDNLMTGQGLDSLKSIFGAAPTEGERKILMDMQASVDKTPKQREAIMDRAIAAAQRRAAYAGNKAKAIRDGSYLTQGVSDQQDPAARTVVRTGTSNGRKVVQYSDGTTEYAD